MSCFITPGTLFYGPGTLAELASLKSNRACIVTGTDPARNDRLERIIGHMEKASPEIRMIEIADTEPTTAMITKGTHELTAFAPDLIVAAGSAFAIGAARAMWLFYEYPEQTFSQASQPVSHPLPGRKARFVAIPATSGTATEAASFAVILDTETREKYPVADYSLTPDIVIVDPDLAITIPPELTAYTGMDTLSRAIEAYVSTRATELTDALAMKAIEMVNSYLPRSYTGSKKAGEKMHLAQCMAGMAFSNAILGIAHSMAHQSSVHLNIPHGCASAIFLPHVIAFNAETVPARYADIARRTGFSCPTEKEEVKSLVMRINELNRRLRIPLTLMEYGVREDFFNARIDEMAARAAADPCAKTNPRPVSEDAVRKLFRLAFYGS